MPAAAAAAAADARAFVDELCRFHTGSALATRRVAEVDIALGGQVRVRAARLRADDPGRRGHRRGDAGADVFPGPGRFDMHRARGRGQALGFGFGEHRCIGEHLARVELEIALCGWLCFGIRDCG